MRWISMLTALLVTVSFYLLMMERDRVMVFAGVEPAPAPAADTGGSGPQKVSVLVQRSTAQQVQGGVRLRGETEAARSVEVLAETDGRVISEPLKKGSAVAAGQTLCRIEPGTRPSALAQARAVLAESRARLPEARAAVAQARAQLDEARINDRAARRLSQEGYASDTRVAGTASAVSTAEAAVASATAGLEAVETARKTAEAQVATAEIEIERLTIAAPFAGVLDEDTAELGTLMQPGLPCATVIALDPIRLVGAVPETEVDKIRVGAPAGGRLLSGQEIAGRVAFVARTTDPATRTFRVEVEAPNADGAIRAGQSVEIGIAGPARSGHLVPASALTLDDAGRLGLRYVDDTSHARFAPVEVIRDAPEGMWVAGLPDSAEVIVVGQEFVSDGTPVEVSYLESPQ
ncbi:efflux transporter periplasmic adaptor subunit [Rhodovulum sulfidophilum]|uniref:Efflux RND transporter periplasmic adaptor subunit n=1 Tax=Rhodovulum visakhapatnamense TaxID=364297 RepID=A0ABS1RIU6_9RHOB|nr:efflux RND transporter periplasmic adaptor subunit [Rhodovulum visakhapatnamense]MBL3570866.1 efflux RND transporter periplasmic adaptor subunit [Rhodovulum visakhapatnamense]MBL3578817.1 efflux RND transporter periplasmic adaptor subunit [Rhodovulum visakhapatnamense]OLS44215.1 efflux transporter periplasmic adaptor subunit [Rhodovulum sulfidophilum]